MAAAPIHKEDIKASLRKQFGAMSRFERVKALPEGSVRDVLRGRATAKTEQAISEALGKPLHVLFPRRYNAPTRDAESTNVDDKRVRRTAHRLNAERV